MMVDFTKFDFPSIMGVIKSTDGLKRNQTRPLRTEVQEIAIAEYSGGQFKYVGDTEDGRDFYGCLLYTSPSPRDGTKSRMPSSA